MSQPSALRSGAVLFDRYRLVAPLGEGLGGETWRAEPLDGGDPVAIKVVPAVAGTAQHGALVREASFLRNLSHPHVVPYLGLIDLPGSGATFLVTALADGDLEGWVEQAGPCAPGRVAGLLLQLAEGLQAVHGGGVLHRDLKPGNVLVRRTPSGPHLMLADFGISRSTVDSAAVLTLAMGSIGYGAPEVWSQRKVTQAADIWSLGAIGWFLLTAQHPQPKAGSFLPDVGELEALAMGDAPRDRGALVGLLVEMMHDDPASRPALARVWERLVLLADASAPVRTRTLEPPAADARPAAPPPHPPREDATGAWGGRSAPTVPVAPRPSSSRRIVFATGILASVGLVGALLGAWLLSPPAPAPAPTAAAPDPASLPAPAPDAPAPTVAAGEAATPARVTLPTHAAVEPPAVAPPPAAPALDDAPPTTTGAPLASTDPAPAVEDAPPDGPIDRLRVGLDAPDGLPAEATLRVVGPGGEKEASNTQVLLEGVRAGRWTVEVRTATRVLGRAKVPVHAASNARVRCSVPGADFGALRCEPL